MKSVTTKMIAKRAFRTGDKSWTSNSTAFQTKDDADCGDVDYENMSWGWNDQILSPEMKQAATITH